MRVLARIDSPDMARAVAHHRQALELRSLSPRTLAAYQRDYAHFQEWLHAHGGQEHDLTTPERIETALLIYLEFHLHHRDPSKRLLPSTMERRLSGIRNHVRRRGLPWPSDPGHLYMAIAVARRELGHPPKQAAPISVPLLRQMVSACGDSTKCIRDRTILLVGFCAALRRSELVALNWSDLRFDAEGVRITIARSKGDQAGSGRYIYLRLGHHAQTCPVSALRAWRQRCLAGDDPVFTSISKSGQVKDCRLTPDVVDTLVRNYASRAQPGSQYSAHSLRAGLATAAAQAGADDRDIMATTGHRSRTTLDGYVRTGRGYANSVMTYLDL